jgi:hypothetical protein
MQTYSVRGVLAIGGSLTGSLNMPGKLFIYPDRLMIRAMWQEYSFPRASIVALQVVRVLFWRTIQIEHSMPEESALTEAGTI